MTGVAVTQQAAYEPALHHTGEEHEEGNLHIVCKLGHYQCENVCVTCCLIWCCSLSWIISSKKWTIKILYLFKIIGTVSGKIVE